MRAVAHYAPFTCVSTEGLHELMCPTPCGNMRRRVPPRRPKVLIHDPERRRELTQGSTLARNIGGSLLSDVGYWRRAIQVRSFALVGGHVKFSRSLVAMDLGRRAQKRRIPARRYPRHCSTSHESTEWETKKKETRTPPESSLGATPLSPLERLPSIGSSLLACDGKGERAALAPRSSGRRHFEASSGEVVSICRKRWPFAGCMRTLAQRTCRHPG